MVTVLTLGTFDLPHNGHFKLLKRAKALGDRLIVAVNTDEFVESYKGRRPVLSTDQRASIIEECKYVDAVVLNEDCGKSIILKVNPDFIVIGSDWLSKDYAKQLGFATIEEVPCRVLYVPYTDNVSTTSIRGVLNE